jgi:hypothetical protein
MHVAKPVAEPIIKPKEPKERTGRKFGFAHIPAWAWLMMVGVGGTYFVGGSLALGIVVAANSGPKKTCNQLHREMVGMSEIDLFRRFGTPDRQNHDHRGGGWYYYANAALHDETHKPCGIQIRTVGGNVFYVTDWK